MNEDAFSAWQNVEEALVQNASYNPELEDALFRLQDPANRMGIYAVRCIPTRAVYIGKSTRFNVRRTNHFTDLRHNRHDNKPMQEAWNLYGEKSFEFVILDAYPKIGYISLGILERRWITEARRNGVALFNITLTKIPRTEHKLAMMHLLTS